MTVGELRDHLDGVDDKMQVAAYRELDDRTDFFEIGDVSEVSGEPMRHEDTRKAGFKFKEGGPTRWLFISLEEA